VECQGATGRVGKNTGQGLWGGTVPHCRFPPRAEKPRRPHSGKEDRWKCRPGHDRETLSGSFLAALRE